MSLAFLGLGPQKFSDPFWIALFEKLGFGDGLRYLTGGMQIVGAVLLLIPRTVLVGVLLRATTMVGAMFAWIYSSSGPPRLRYFQESCWRFLVAIGITARSG